MKKLLIGLLAVIVLGTAGFFVYTRFAKAPGSNNPMASSAPAGTAWKYNKAIASPITQKVATDTDATLGDVEKDKSSVKIFKGALANETEIKLDTPDSVPNYAGEEVDMIGAPVEISAGQPTRLDEAALVSFKVEKSSLPADGSTSTLRIAYYDGSSWEYLKPVSIDMDSGIVTFRTFHFSLFGLTKIKKQTVITEHWIHSKTLDNELRYKINKATDKVSGKIIDLALEKMGIKDKNLASKVLADVLKEDGYKKIYDAYGKGDMVDLDQQIAILAAKKIAQIVPESTLQAGLKHFADEKGVGDAGALGTAAGYAAEGQYKDAAKVIADRILDKTAIGLAGKIGVEAVKWQIASWKDSEVEAAYIAYKNGANGVFYGYNADKGDFDTIWDQMRGIRRQLEIEAIKKENEARVDAGLPALDEKQMDALRDQVKNSYAKQFEERAKRDEDFAAEEKKLKMLVDAYTKAGIFDETLGPVGLDKGLDYENKLDVLYHFSEKIMADTKRFELSDKNGLIMDKAISVDDIAQGAKFWFSGPDGVKKYKQFLKDRFNISLYPELKDLAGKWSGSFTIKSIDIPEELKNQNKGKEDENGCDFNMDLSQLIGKTQPVTLNVKPTSDTGGNIDFGSKDSEPKTLPFTYEDGVIKMAFSEKGAVATIALNVAEEKDNYTAIGSMNMTYAEGKVKINADMSTSKPIKPAVPAPAKPADKKK
ncbi:MAG: hypothetical protein WC551_05695 [Patescibacteria group bacterium]